MNPEQPCGIGGRPFSPPDHLHDFGLLLRRELKLSATYRPAVIAIAAHIEYRHIRMQVR